MNKQQTYYFTPATSTKVTCTKFNSTDSLAYGEQSRVSAPVVYTLFSGVYKGVAAHNGKGICRTEPPVYSPRYFSTGTVIEKHLHQHSEPYPFFLILKPILLTSSFKSLFPAKGFSVSDVNPPCHVSRLSIPGYSRVTPVSILVFFYMVAAINGWGAFTPAVLAYVKPLNLFYRPLLLATRQQPNNTGEWLPCCRIPVKT
jgi:hypothetical protein